MRGPPNRWNALILIAGLFLNSYFTVRSIRPQVVEVLKKHDETHRLIREVLDRLPETRPSGEQRKP